MALNPPEIEGQVTTLVITDPAVAADTDIDLDANDPKISTVEPYPVISIDVIDFDTTGPSFAFTKFNIGDYGTLGSLGATEMCVKDEDTIRVGIALNAANHQYILIIKHIAGRTKTI